MKKILIAENNPSDLSFYESTLQKSNYCVTIAANVQEFLQRYKSELEHAVLAARDNGHSSPSSSIALPFDAVVLNHRASDGDGLQAAKEILSVNPRQRVVLSLALSNIPKNCTKNSIVGWTLSKNPSSRRP